jgi:DNA topoisomerase-2
MTWKIIGGQNGIGAKCAIIFSLKFEVETVDYISKTHYQIFENNMSIVHPPKIEKNIRKTRYYYNNPF